MTRSTFIRLVALLLALGGGGAFAGPVTSDQAPSHMAPPAETGVASDADPAASSAAALATKILEEAQAGAAADDGAVARRPKPTAAAAASGPAGTASAAPARAASGNAARPPEESPVRKAAKAAVAWVKDVVPGLQSEGDEGDGEASPPPEAVNWDRSGLAGGADGLAGSALGGAGYGSGGAGGLGLPPTSPGSSEEPLRQLLRDAVELITTLLTHPMAWLVLGLFAIGGYAMNRFDRRPK